MELYKKEKINPVAGCWPVLIQIPVFFALYKVLFVTIEMRHAPFFGWIRDLAAPDPTSVFNLFGLLPYNPGSVPVIGHFLMLGAWPLIMGVTMWLQMKMNPEPPDPVQKQVFAWMPVIFTFMLGSFPAGLVIYWAWNNLLSVTQQGFIMRRNGVKIELWDNLRALFGKKSPRQGLNTLEPPQSKIPGSLRGFFCLRKPGLCGCAERAICAAMTSGWQRFMAPMHENSPSGAAMAQRTRAEAGMRPARHRDACSITRWSQARCPRKAAEFLTPPISIRRIRPCGTPVSPCAFESTMAVTSRPSRPKQARGGIAFDRSEWDTEVDGPMLDLRAAAGTPLAPFLDDEAIGRQIRPVFTVRTRRHAFLIDAHRATIELALDRTIVKSGRRTQPSHRNRTGTQGRRAARPVSSSRRNLPAPFRLRLSMLTKSERGYRLLERSATGTGQSPAAPYSGRHGER